MLHERDDDEPAAVGEGADLEGHPGQRPESADCSPWRTTAGMKARTEPGDIGRPAAADDDLGHAARQETSTRYGPTVAAAAPPTSA